MKNLEKFIRVEQASEHKKIDFAQCKIKKTSKNTAKFTKIRASNISQNYVYTFKNQREMREIHRNEKWKRKINILYALLSGQQRLAYISAYLRSVFVCIQGSV